MLSGEDKEISLAGGRFCFAYELWLDPQTLDLECPADLDPLNPRRYEDDPLQKLAIVAELYGSLSPNLRASLMNADRRESFKDLVRLDSSIIKCSSYSQRHTKFMYQLNQERSNIVHAARQIVNELLGPGFERKTFQTSFTDRESDPRLQALLQNPNKPTERYPFDALMLFPLGDCTKVGQMFEVEVLSKVSSRICFARIYTDCTPVS